MCTCVSCVGYMQIFNQRAILLTWQQRGIAWFLCRYGLVTSSTVGKLLRLLGQHSRWIGWQQFCLYWPYVKIQTNYTGILLLIYFFMLIFFILLVHYLFLIMEQGWQRNIQITPNPLKGQAEKQIMWSAKKQCDQLRNTVMN